MISTSSNALNFFVPPAQGLPQPVIGGAECLHLPISAESSVPVRIGASQTKNNDELSAQQSLSVELPERREAPGRPMQVGSYNSTVSLQGGAPDALEPHKLNRAGSIPAPATNSPRSADATPFFLRRVCSVCQVEFGKTPCEMELHGHITHGLCPICFAFQFTEVMEECV